jgi:hypothetical protein
MKYLFRPDPNGTHTRNADNVRGNLRELPDTATVQPVSALVDPADYTVLPAEPEPEAPTPDPGIPQEIANWRARAALEIAGLLPTVEAALAAMTGPEGIVARNAWNSGASLARNGPTVVALAAQLNLTDAQVDALFQQAASLNV